ncbi:DUF4242 domain-containing protein (plasmid) [Pseudonocardia bannensis]|uniref:DUF4242 domain-containing protein n=1 Tax=Pseudonocardia bannensis TaxID=630973 RepID=A0A848DQV5_9PSEU|nr:MULTISPECIES: DUF4242 domain-containing protein [Pseudonocardia]NMH94925.1 DUF4242 domain-containing protein [Pseudonocardia bannensis]
MSLYLLEFVPARTDREGVTALLAEIDKAAANAAGELIESQVTGDHGLVFAVVEAADAATVKEGFDGLAGAARVTGPDEVRLVGADLAELKAARPAAGWLVEWDLPETLDMDTYLARKKEKAPRYADVPEVSFLRTYVREDMAKCLCFYDADSADIVRQGRAAVDTPIDRLHALEQR